MIVFIYLISFLQGLIFALILLFSKSYRSPVNKYLAYTILVISVLGLLNGIDIGIGDSYIFFYEMFRTIPLEMLFPATLFTFVSLKSGSKIFEGKYPLLYMPFCLFSVINCLIVIFDIFGLLADFDLLPFIYFLFDFQLCLSLIYSAIVGVISFILIHNTKYIEEANKKWLRFLIAIYFTLILIWVISEIYDMLTDTESIYLEYSLWFGVTTFFYWVSYKGLIRFKLLGDRYEITQIIHSSLAKETKEIKKETSNIYFNKIETLMQNEHAYLDSNLCRENIANQIGISPGYLSKIISSITNDNFSEYVNSYRVDAVKSMIQNQEFDKYSLLAIGYESGFSSKTGFYNAFKKRTGMTPNAYKTRTNRS